MKKITVVVILFTIFLFLSVSCSRNVSACKDIIAIGDATEGDYNLLMKVRDPSRPGPQVLSIVPEGYEYDYHYPWTGKTMSFTTKHKYIGIASEDDILPNIVKAGMSLSTSGLAYSDADTGSGWINPIKRYAWDDFDWIRYACQTADDEDEAYKLLTEDCVDKLHATNVPENLFVAGPKKGYVIEADAYHYEPLEINNGVAVMHNYPKALWKTQRLQKWPISRTFDTVVEKTVRKFGVVRLKSSYGVRVTSIDEDSITVKPVGIIHAFTTNSIGVITEINIGERKSVGRFSVTLLDIEDKKAKVRVTNVFKAWEEEMLKHIEPRYGSITVNDLMKWSRLSSDDLNGLRSMVQEGVEFETVAIYRIPKHDFDVFSLGWFSPNHAWSSIYVPYHICNDDFFEPYKNGDAALISLDLLGIYEPSKLSENFTKIEDVLILENENLEQLSKELYSEKTDIAEFLTSVDISMQKQAYWTEELWMQASKITNQKEIIRIISTIWADNYIATLDNMSHAVDDLSQISNSRYFIEKIIDIALEICKVRINTLEIKGISTELCNEEYEKAQKEYSDGNYEKAFNNIQKTSSLFNALESGEEPIYEICEKSDTSIGIILAIFFLVILLIFVFVVVFFSKR